MLRTASPLILKLSPFLMTAVATHLVMSFGQTLIHYKVAHHPMGGKIFRNHINFHHTHYSTLILSLGRISATKATQRPTSLFPYFYSEGALISYYR
jgi:hypothetical protein